MKTNKVRWILSTAVVLLMVWAFASCSKKNDAVPLNDTVLNDSITVATALSASTTEGVQDGQYTVGAKATLGTAISAAQAIASSTSVTQTQITNAVVSLSTAIAAYRAALIIPVAIEALVGHWGFDEGTGTSAHDASVNAFTGTFKAGRASWGSVVPLWIADRKGVAGKALQFNKGASVEIPYNTKLNPVSLSFAVWVKVDTINANNRFLGLQSWLGYKFQLQDGNLPFATIQTSVGDFDHDAATAIPAHAWHHLAVTYVSGTETFYIDGISVKVWTDVTGTASSISAKPYNLVIGADFPADKYSLNDGTNFNLVGDVDYHVIPLAWGGHFIGGIDELRIYNTALTGAQITSIYNREK